MQGVIEVGMKAGAIKYLDAKCVQAAFTREVSDAIRPFDVALTPTTPGAAPRDLTSTGNPMFKTPFSIGGFPAITLPSGFTPTVYPPRRPSHRSPLARDTPTVGDGMGIAAAREGGARSAAGGITVF